MLLLHVLFVAIGAASAAAAATSKLASRDAPLLKLDRDEFCQPPAGFESKPPGTILRTRAVPHPIDATLEGAPVGYTSAHQVLYRITDSFGKAIATVTTILAPKKSNTSQLLSFQVIEEAANLGCAPSYSPLQRGAEQKTHLDAHLTGLQLGSINNALKNGWYVTVPDALGPKAAFLANNLTGYATLASSSFTNVSAHATSLIWGYSSGSLR